MSILTVLSEIRTVGTSDPLQFVCRQNRSTDEAVSTAIHTALTHLKGKDTYVKMQLKWVLYSTKKGSSIVMMPSLLQ